MNIILQTAITVKFEIVRHLFEKLENGVSTIWIIRKIGMRQMNEALVDHCSRLLRRVVMTTGHLRCDEGRW